MSSSTTDPHPVTLRAIDLLLDEYANALYLHKDDDDPKVAVRECALCKGVIHRFYKLRAIGEVSS